MQNSVILTKIKNSIEKNATNTFYKFDNYRPWIEFSNETNEEGVKEFANFEIAMSDVEIKHEIKYHGVFDLLAMIGGLTAALYLIFEFVLGPII